MLYGVSGVSIPNLHFALINNGKMPVPVNPASLMYSNFQYVAGVPAPEGSEGVSITRLHLLNVIIGQLNQAGLEPSFKTLGNQFEDLDSLTDALIEAGRNQILEAQQASIAMPYIPSPNTPIGLLFDLSS